MCHILNVNKTFSKTEAPPISHLNLPKSEPLTESTHRAPAKKEHQKPKKINPPNAPKFSEALDGLVVEIYRRYL